MASIICEQCGTQRHKCPSNTKLCRPCATLRDAIFTAAWPTRKCNQRDCEERFAPLGRADLMCGKCSRSLHRGYCGWCDQADQPLLKPDLSICMACAKDPSRRSNLIDALEIRQKRSRAENDWPGCLEATDDPA